MLVGEWEGESLVYRGTLEYGFMRSAVVQILTQFQPFVRPTSPFADLKPREDVI